MAHYNVSTGQLLSAAILTAVIAAGSVVGFNQYRELQSLPVVESSESGNCLRVINFKNGDAYNCEDVDVVLRHYKKALFVEPPKPEGTEQSS